MATSINVNIASGTPWTVPANKKVIGRAFYWSGTAQVFVDGVGIGVTGSTSGENIGPICADAGQTLSTTSGGFGFSGQLYDV
jgi:hypothetical protein